MQISLINKLERFVFSINIHRHESPLKKGGINYNCPFTLLFVFIAFFVHLAYQTSYAYNIDRLFSVSHNSQWSNPLEYASLVLYVFGDNGQWSNIADAMMLIILIGPIVEERIGFIQLCIAVLATTVITGFVSALLFNSELFGPTCVAYLLVFLASFVNFKKGQIPASFLLVLFAVILMSSQRWMQNLSNAFPMIAGSLMGWFWGMSVRRVMAKNA